MPILDVSDAFDVEMLDDIQVIRRTQNMVRGRVQPVTEKPLTIAAVVTAASPDDLARLPEAEYMGKAISIYTQYRLRGPATDEVGNTTLPDHVLYHNSVYVVRALDDFSGFGVGFVSAVATSIQAVDPEMPNPIGSA